MRVVIAGGTGLVGRALSYSLAADDHDVVVLSRRPERVDAELAARCRVVGWDPANRGDWMEVVDGADAVVQLAGEGIASGYWTEAKKAAIRSSRVESSRLLAVAVERAAQRPRVFVQGSAVGFFGDRGDRELDDMAPRGQGFLAETCEAWEAASAGLDELGVRRAIARTGLVLARDDGLLPAMARPFRLFVGGPVGDGSQWMPWIHLDDEVRGLRFLLERDDAAGPFNLSAPNPATNRALSRELAAALGRPSWLRAPGLVVSRLEMGRELLLASQRAVPRRLLEIGFDFRFPTLAESLSDLLDRTP